MILKGGRKMDQGEYKTNILKALIKAETIYAITENKTIRFDIEYLKSCYLSKPKDEDPIVNHYILLAIR